MAFVISQKIFGFLKMWIIFFLMAIGALLGMLFGDAFGGTPGSGLLSITFTFTPCHDHAGHLQKRLYILLLFAQGIYSCVKRTIFSAMEKLGDEILEC